jgi:hypothetical protein
MAMIMVAIAMTAIITPVMIILLFFSDTAI